MRGTRGGGGARGGGSAAGSGILWGSCAAHARALVLLCAIAMLPGRVHDAMARPGAVAAAPAATFGGLEHDLPRAPGDWPGFRREVLHALEDVMGERPPGARGVPFEVRVLGETRRDSIVERRIEYRSERDDWVPAILLLLATTFR